MPTARILNVVWKLLCPINQVVNIRPLAKTILKFTAPFFVQVSNYVCTGVVFVGGNHTWGCFCLVLVLGRNFW